MKLPQLQKRTMPSVGIEAATLGYRSYTLHDSSLSLTLLSTCTGVSMVGWASTVPSACQPCVSSTARIRANATNVNMSPQENHSVLDAGGRYLQSFRVKLNFCHQSIVFVVNDLSGDMLNHSL